MPNRCAWIRKVSGSTDGRLVVGASFPFGPVTPHATCSPGIRPRFGEMRTECTPVKTALQIRAYSKALSKRHFAPTRLNCGSSQIGLFGSFHAVHMLTFGRGAATPKLGS